VTLADEGAERLDYDHLAQADIVGVTGMNVQRFRMREVAGRPVGDDTGDGVAAAVVVAEDLAEEPPDGRHRVEQPVAEGDAVLGERVEDAGLRQGLGEGQAEAAREAGADLLQGSHEGSRVSVV
jgi:hypothetical protein